jgi:alanine-synthesizing transaminase
MVPNPSYPIHAFGFMMAGASIRHLPTTEGSDFMVMLERAAKHSVPAPTVLVVNYPSNPTAEVRGLDFYTDIVDFCRKRNIWVLSDMAYSELYFDDNPPPSILQVPGAMDIAVEFGSLSKTYSMPGWRMGYAVGNKKLINALTRIKSYLDYGAFARLR